MLAKLKMNHRCFFMLDALHKRAVRTLNEVCDVVGVLQNAWSPSHNWDQNTEHGYLQWTRALLFSMTGSRLLKCLGPDMYAKIAWHNSSNSVARKPRGAEIADPNHIQLILRQRQPTLIVAFGQIAERAVNYALWPAHKTIVVCHPSAYGILWPSESLMLRERIEKKLRCSS